jgi:hypothetical protein
MNIKRYYDKNKYTRKIAKPFEYTNKWYWISVLRGINRIIHFNFKWDFKNKNWRLK